MRRRGWRLPKQAMPLRRAELSAARAADAPEVRRASAQAHAASEQARSAAARERHSLQAGFTRRASRPMRGRGGLLARTTGSSHVLEMRRAPRAHVRGRRRGTRMPKRRRLRLDVQIRGSLRRHLGG